MSERERPDLTLTEPCTTAPVGAAWIDAAWAVLQARPEFSMLPHALEKHEFERLAPGPQPVVYGRAPASGGGPRIVFFGMASDFGAAFLLALMRAGRSVVAVVTSSRQKRHRLPHDFFSLVQSHAGIPRHALRHVNHPESRELIAGYRPDLIVIASFDQILKRELIEVPRLGVLNCHPSLLPAYRGPEPLFWQIMHDEPRAGITIHRVNELIDAGPILGQAGFPVGVADTSGTLARKAAFAGIPVLLGVVDRLARGEPVPALHPPWRESYQGAVESRPADWREPAGAIARLVRAGRPDMPPYALSGGRRLYLGRAEAVPGAPGEAPGRIVARAPGWIDVATGDGRLRVYELLDDLPGRPNARATVPLATAPDRFDPAFPE